MKSLVMVLLLLATQAQASLRSRDMERLELATLDVCSDTYCEGDFNLEQVEIFYMSNVNAIKVYTAWTGPNKKIIYKYTEIAMMDEKNPSVTRSFDNIAMAILNATCPDVLVD